MPQVNDPSRITPLLTAIRACNDDERREFAELAGMTESYLYTLAGASREPLVSRAVALADASRRMHEKNPRIPVVTVEQLAEMHTK